MSARRNRPGRPRPAGGGRKESPDKRIPDVPPMQDRTLSWWPLVIALAAFLLWLIWLAVLATHSERWRAG